MCQFTKHLTRADALDMGRTVTSAPQDPSKLLLGWRLVEIMVQEPACRECHFRNHPSKLRPPAYMKRNFIGILSKAKNQNQNQNHAPPP